MGAFHEVAPVLAEHNIAAIPTQMGIPSMPLVKHPDKFGVHSIKKTISKGRFRDANAALWCGAKSGITIVDVDSPSEVQLDAAIEVFGNTPLMVKTASGGWHLYYRHKGEKRDIRPFGKECPIDVLGNGIAILPPSTRQQTDEKCAGSYSIIEGSLKDLEHLPLIKSGAINTHAEKHSSGVSIKRNDDLFRALLRVAKTAVTLDDLLAVAQEHNDGLVSPLPSEEVVKTAQSAWGYQIQGENWVSGEARAVITESDLERLGGDSDAAYLLTKLRIAHGWRGGTTFALARAMAASMNWTIPRFMRARSCLSESGLIQCHHVGGDGPRDPPIYALT